MNSIDLESKLQRARQLLDARDIALHELASQVQLSPAYLQKRFKQAYGLSPADYAAQRKIGVLKKRLRQAPDITQAWVDSGYGSSSRVYENGAAKLGMLPADYRKGGAGLTVHWTMTSTALGAALIAATERGICAVALSESQSDLLAELQREFPNATLNPVSEGAALIADKVRAVADILAGRTAAVDIELMRLPTGQTRSYADLAEGLGMPKAARAVARACASNRVAVLVPCHRIVRGDGSLGGYRWGLPMKARLLERESRA
jgi:AraC family transcriptional regulator, regulatory protein of adaptative response / methylated-DNA-[protein]-cysteine methyltransferase